MYIKNCDKNHNFGLIFTIAYTLTKLWAFIFIFKTQNFNKITGISADTYQTLLSDDSASLEGFSNEKLTSKLKLYEGDP